MKSTNYANIANRYDKNRYRQEVGFDYDLKACADLSADPDFKVLDLGCGTGIYLQRQIKNFADYPIEWHGLDPSEEMLDIARTKADSVTFVKGYAEHMPYDTESFNFIANNFSFHHYQGKAEALDEVARILRKSGVYKMHNIAIHDMTKWWVYQFFPSAYYEDLQRFWSKEQIFGELSDRGMTVSLRMEYKLLDSKLADLMDYAYNRDISSLTIISDEDYHSGLELMEYKLKKDPEIKVRNDFAEIFFIGEKI